MQSLVRAVKKGDGKASLMNIREIRNRVKKMKKDSKSSQKAEDS